MTRCNVSFSQELDRVLPLDLPERPRLILLASRHLELVEETNRVMNLTRIVSAAEAAVKHVYDSVRPWRHFQNASSVLDAGTGAGFPGIPLAIVLPDVRFALTESVQKRARFVEASIETLGLGNVSVRAVRAEDLLRSQRFDRITARAVAPLAKAIPLFAAAVNKGSTILLYKGPDVEAEMEDARTEAKERRIAMRVVERYALPDGMGERTILELRR
jgi:16S rRNA (guanine527-N7)-methyltransferase